jgi:calpain-7
LTACIPAGTYILLPSAFTAGEEAAFTLDVKTSLPISLTSLPQEDAGKFTKNIRGQWSGKTAGGCGKNATYYNNPRFLLRIPVTRRLR